LISFHFINTGRSEGKNKKDGIKISCLSHYCFRQEHVSPGMVINNYSGINTDRLEGVMEVIVNIILKDL